MSSNISDRLLNSLTQITAQDEANAQLSRELMDPTEFGAAPGVDDDDYTHAVVDVPQIKIETKESKLPDIPDTNLTADANRVRDVTYAMQEVSIELLKGSVKMACETENPRAYTVCNELMTTIRGLNKDLLEAARTIEEVKQKAKPAAIAEGGTQVEVDEDGKVKVTTAPKGHSTKNLLALVEEMRRNGGNASAVDNDTILDSTAEEVEESEVTEVEEAEITDVAD